MAAKAWEVGDSFWARVKPLIPKAQREKGKEYQRRKGAGRKPMESRKIFEAVVYVLRTGIQWKALPREYGNSSCNAPLLSRAALRKRLKKGFFVGL